MRPADDLVLGRAPGLPALGRDNTRVVVPVRAPTEGRVYLGLLGIRGTHDASTITVSARWRPRRGGLGLEHDLGTIALYGLRRATGSGGLDHLFDITNLLGSAEGAGAEAGSLELTLRLGPDLPEEARPGVLELVVFEER